MPGQRLTELIPLHQRDDGTIRVSNTRITLDTVVEAFESGATPEEIVQDYPSLGLADVYAIVAYYLRHEREVKAYLRERQKLVESTQKENRSRSEQRGLRDRLLARQSR